MEKSTNIQIGNKKPSEYMNIVISQVKSGSLDSKHPIGKITDKEQLAINLEQNCIPEGFENLAIEDYDGYLKSRRRLMVAKIEKYYKSL